MTANEILEKLKGQHVLIVGDVMVDRYLMGNVSRISPEAPVPVVHQHRTDDRLGGAANVALNICALGAVPVLCSVVGNDTDGAALVAMLPGLGIRADGVFHSSDRKTTVKTRVLGNNQQMLRIDQEDVHDLCPDDEQQLINRTIALLDTLPVRAIIFQDYNKGVLTPTVIQSVSETARQRGIFTAVDPKKVNFFAYQGVSLFKPNLKEIRDSAPFPVEPTVDSLQQAATFLRQNIHCQTIMITLSEKGLFLDDEKTSRLYPTVPRNVADVSGAGDTVVSIATLGMAAGWSNDVVAALSNLAGGQVCEYPGVVPVRNDILARELDYWLQQN